MIDIHLLNYLETYLTNSRKQRFSQVLSSRTNHFTVATEDVYHLHNTSAVIRSCDIFGIQNIHIVEERLGKRIDREIALGAQKWVDVNRYLSIKDCIKAVKEKGYQVVATTPHTNDAVLDDFNISKPSCFFFGRETEGLSESVLSEADCFLKIPMVGFTESLNVSVSAAIVLQHVTSKLKASDIVWQLSQEEQMEKRLDWMQKTLKNYDALVKHYYESK